ncbi:MAG: hypothetical protein AAF560_25785 [Acidobacteriota bacterium]
MNSRIVIIGLLFLISGLSALLMLQWNFGVGNHIVSPQEVTVPLGARMILAGGRAGVEFDQRRDRRGHFVVRCQDEQSWVKLKVGQTSEEICSVRIHLQEFTTETGTLASSRAHLEVTWGPEASSEEPTR